MKRGFFFTFEGGEGAGKTTLIEGIEKRLLAQKLQVIKTREPGGTVLGEKCRELLLKEKISLSAYAELALFLASRAQHLFEVIEPALKRGAIVLCDRFNDSSIAYQGYARGLGDKEVEKVCLFFSQNRKADLTFYLDIDPEVGLKRASIREEKDRIESEEISFHQKIREGYLFIQKKEPARFHLLDGNLEPKQLLSQAMEIIEKCFKQS